MPGLLESLLRRQQETPRHILDILAPALTAKSLGEPLPPVPNIPDEPGKTAGTGDPRNPQAAYEAATLLAAMAPASSPARLAAMVPRRLMASELEALAPHLVGREVYYGGAGPFARHPEAAGADVRAAARRARETLRKFLRKDDGERND
jgi:hypothetical protein